MKQFKSCNEPWMMGNRVETMGTPTLLRGNHAERALPTHSEHPPDNGSVEVWDQPIYRPQPALAQSPAQTQAQTQAQSPTSGPVQPGGALLESPLERVTVERALARRGLRLRNCPW